MSFRSKAAAGCLVAAYSLSELPRAARTTIAPALVGSGRRRHRRRLLVACRSRAPRRRRPAPCSRASRSRSRSAGNKAGDTTIKYTSLDDSTAQAGNWDPAQVAANARKAAQDKDAVAYIGEFNSGASAISIPILNQAGLGMISPANTYPGLTTSEPGTEPGEPDKYYPTGKRNYARIVPRDKIQAAALVTQFKDDGCTSVAIANDKETYGAGLARIVVLDAKALNLKTTSTPGIQKDSPNYRSYAEGLKAAGVDCFLFSGVTANGAVQINKDVAAALPNAKLYGPDGTCESGFTNPQEQGHPGRARSALQVHGGDAGDQGHARRCSVPEGLPGEVRRLQPGSVRDLRLRGGPAGARHDQGRRDDARTDFVTKLFETKDRRVGARHILDRRQRRHDR